MTLPVQVGEGQEVRVWWRVSIDKKDVGLQLMWVGADGTTPLTQPRRVEAGGDAGGWCGAWQC